MPRDHVTEREQSARAGRAGRAGTCARAGLFAVLGTLLATFGHHAIAEGTVPWRLVGASSLAQFAAVWPLARRRYGPVATILFTLAVQGVLHLALSYADGDTATGMAGHAMHAGHSADAVGDGHAWHHAGAAMTAVHVVAALVVAWLLHRADTRMTAALGMLRLLARAAVAALAQVLPRPVRDTGRTVVALPDRRPGASFEVSARAWDDVLEHAVVRRGPPRREHLQSVAGPGRLRDRLFPYQQGVPLCSRPSIRWPVRVAVSLLSVLPR
ncbi:hypothetical protein OHA74_12840 [Streptomyces phaeochromogenes]|uniref:hypothetical protein n=1 Tax=Streptomyces phaeochromogenes TaxID=1923 RepID=UPI002E2C8220|nr:hypothetical protein [Streptomyces phaeochromogenes]